MADQTLVLQVDDEPEFLEMSATLLERAADELTVETATSGEAALDRLAEGGVDCVVSDYDMPGMDGLELLRAVRERHPNLPFVLLTARGSETVASEAVSAGVDDYLQKSGGEEQYELLANRLRNLVQQARAERSYREIFDNATVGLTVRDEETGELLDVNQRYCDLLGYERAELLDLELGAVSATDEGYTAERFVEHVHRAREEGLTTFEWRDQRKDGERIWVEASLRPAEIEGTRRLLGSVRDITDRKRREQELETAREYYRTIAANLPSTSVAIYDTDLVYEVVDGGIFEDLELDPGSLEGEPLGAVHSASFVEAHLPKYEAALEGERRVFEFEYAGRQHRAHTLPVTDDDGVVIAGMVVARDVTDERGEAE